MIRKQLLFVILVALATIFAVRADCGRDARIANLEAEIANLEAEITKLNKRAEGMSGFILHVSDQVQNLKAARKTSWYLPPATEANP